MLAPSANQRSKASWDSLAHSDKVIVASQWADRNKFNPKQLECLVSVLNILEVS